MSALRSETAPRPALPSLAWWLMLLPLLGLVMLDKPLVAFGLLVLIVIERARPFHFLTSYMMVMVLGSFINYGSGTLTAQMTVLTVFLLFMLYCFVLSRRWDSLVFPRTPATLPMLLFFVLTGINFLRGLVAGNSARFAGLELLACLALASCLLMASRKLSPRELWAAMLVMWGMSLGHFALGAYVFATIHMRTIGVYFAPIPGVVAVMMLNFALREQRVSRAMLWLLAMAPLLAQQFLSFTRGFWLALIGATLFSMIAYMRRGEGLRYRATRSGMVLLGLGGLAALGIVMLSLVLGISEVWRLAGNRFASSVSTSESWASTSNIERLLESAKVIQDIRQQPLFGHGLGYEFMFREPLRGILIQRWFVHENYLMVWLKQGLIGLALWVWLLIGFVRTGLQGGKLADPFEQSWCAGAAAMVVYCMLYGLVHFPLAETNTTFTLALAVGVAMGLTGRDTVAIRWKGRRTVPEGS